MALEVRQHTGGAPMYVPIGSILLILILFFLLYR